MKQYMEVKSTNNAFQLKGQLMVLGKTGAWQNKCNNSQLILSITG